MRDALRQEEPPTFFEAVTAMALLYFAMENTDIAIMEVGMGGRLDATNVITPVVSAITNISMEHQFYLGSRLLDIAGEKGGIIKSGVSVVTGVTQPPVIRLFESIAREKKAPLWWVGREIRYRTTESGFHYYGMRRKLNGLSLGLKGVTQSRNAALALGLVEQLEEKGFEISSGNIKEGLKSVIWSGRMQLFSESPAVLLDGAHNPAAIRALARSIKEGFRYGRLILVIGIMEDKEIGRLLDGIVPISDYVIYTRPVYSRAADPAILMAKAARFGKPGEVAPFLTEALKRARAMADPEDLIVVSGSLYTVGEAMTFFDPETYRTDDI